MYSKNYRVHSKLGLSVIVCWVLLFINGCDQNTMQEVKTPNPNFESGIKFAGQAIAFENLAHSNGTISELTGQRVRYPQLIADIKPSTAQMMVAKLAEHFGEEIRKQPGQSNKVVLYTTGSLEDISLADIQGVSLFSLVNGRLHHRIYKVTNESLTEDKRFTVDTDYFMIAELHLLANAAFKNENISWATFQTANNQQGARVASTTSMQNKFGEAVYPYTGILLSTADGCADCYGGFGNCTGDISGKHCCGTCAPEGDGACPKAPAERYLIQTTGRSTINTEVAYSFRDNFLKKTTKGKQYVDFYYKLGQFGIKTKTLNNDNIADHARLALLSQDVAEKLENGNDADVPVTDEFHKEAKKMLGVYKKAADAKENREVQAIVSIIDQELRKLF